jgi:hypothetical protein
MADRPVPDPARSYERAKPEAESGMGRLDNNKATPTPRPDHLERAVKQGGGKSRSPRPRQTRAIAEHEVIDDSRSEDPNRPQPDHSMHEEEPTDVDFAPTDIHDKDKKRHPRKEGKGGTP